MITSSQKKINNVEEKVEMKQTSVSKHIPVTIVK